MAKKLKFDGKNILTEYASKDDQGNKINETYATKGEVDKATPYFLQTTLDSFTYPADENGNVTITLGQVAQMFVLKGNTKEDLSTWTVSTQCTPNGSFEASVDKTSGVITVNKFVNTANIGYLVITVTKGDISMTKQISFVKSKAGASAGTSGISASLLKGPWPTVSSIDNPTTDSCPLVWYNGELYALGE